MQGQFSGCGRLWALCASIVVAPSLAAAPALEAVEHGPGAITAEANCPPFLEAVSPSMVRLNPCVGDLYVNAYSVHHFRPSVSGPG